jgi:hypothetical protein
VQLIEAGKTGADDKGIDLAALPGTAGRRISHCVRHCCQLPLITVVELELSRFDPTRGNVAYHHNQASP